MLLPKEFLPELLRGRSAAACTAGAEKVRETAWKFWEVCWSTSWGVSELELLRRKEEKELERDQALGGLDGGGSTEVVAVRGTPLADLPPKTAQLRRNEASRGLLLEDMQCVLKRRETMIREV